MELPRLGAVSKLTGLRFLDVDGGTDLTPPDLAQLSSLSRLEGLCVRNSSLLHGCDLTSLAPLSKLSSLDFSLHGDFIELADEDGEADALLRVCLALGMPLVRGCQAEPGLDPKKPPYPAPCPCSEPSCLSFLWEALPIHPGCAAALHRMTGCARA